MRDQGKKVLLIDLDPQANLSQSMGLTEPNQKTVYDALKKEMTGDDSSFSDIIQTVHDMDVIPSALELAQAELELVSIFGRARLLHRMLQNIKMEYDFILIDCPPSVAMLTVNALVASDYILMPVQAEFLGLNGVKSFMKTLYGLKNNLNLEIRVLGMFLTRYDRRKIMNRQVWEELNTAYGSLLFNAKIRTNIALAQAQESGMDIFRYAPKSNGAQDYLALTAECLDRL